MRAVIVVLVLFVALCPVRHAAAQWRQPSFAALSADGSAHRDPPVLVDRGRNPLTIPLLGGLVGGLAMVGLIVHGCGNTDCIFDPTIPAAVGVGLGVAAGVAVELVLQAVERRRAPARADG